MQKGRVIMYPNTNFYYQQPTQQQSIYNGVTAPQGLKGRPVSSFEEARAITIDFDGSTFFFPDLANRRIYTKQINMDGTASLFVYELREQPIENNNFISGDFITREEFDRVIKELRAGASISNQAPSPAPANTTAAKVENGLSKLF